VLRAASLWLKTISFIFLFVIIWLIHLPSLRATLLRRAQHKFFKEG